MTSGSSRPYIVLTDSSGSGGKRFKAIEMHEPRMRGDSLEFTVGGKIDKTSGPIQLQYQYVLRVPIDTPEDPAYGDYDDLCRLFDLCNANETPSDVITLTDHWIQDHLVYFVGDASPQPLTTELVGVNAWFIVGVSFQEIL